MPVAFAPRAGFTAESVGTVAVGDNTLNVTDALNEAGGVLVVPDDDTLLTLVLDEHPALKRTTLKAAEDAQAPSGKKAARSEAAQEAAETRKANDKGD
jgi:hypothetical protein